MAYNLVAENGEMWNTKIMELYKRTSFQEEKDRIYVLYVCLKIKNCNKALDFLYPSKQSQDILKTISFVWANPWEERLHSTILKIIGV